MISEEWYIATVILSTLLLMILIWLIVGTVEWWAATEPVKPAKTVLNEEKSPQGETR